MLGLPEDDLDIRLDAESEAVPACVLDVVIDRVPEGLAVELLDPVFVTVDVGVLEEDDVTEGDADTDRLPLTEPDVEGERLSDRVTRVVKDPDPDTLILGETRELLVDVTVAEEL